jgi:hypothetical protein
MKHQASDRKPVAIEWIIDRLMQWVGDDLEEGINVSLRRKQFVISSIPWLLAALVVWLWVRVARVPMAVAATVVTVVGPLPAATVAMVRPVTPRPSPAARVGRVVTPVRPVVRARPD